MNGAQQAKETGSHYGMLSENEEEAAMNMDEEDTLGPDEIEQMGPNENGDGSEDMQIVNPSEESSDKGQGATTGSKPTTVRIRNKLGGKNPQLGPRVRDVKKAAPEGGQLKATLNLNNGPATGQTKENQHPNK